MKELGSFEVAPCFTGGHCRLVPTSADSKYRLEKSFASLPLKVRELGMFNAEKDKLVTSN
jgi:hypothetical protein